MAEKVITSLSDKHSEPMIMRRYTSYGFPVYIALICGANLDDLDEFHAKLSAEWDDVPKSIQSLRNYFGNMTKAIVDHYGKDVTEGCAVIAFADKMVVSSLWGDFMVHLACKNELFTLLSMTTLV